MKALLFTGAALAAFVAGPALAATPLTPITAYECPAQSAVVPPDMVRAAYLQSAKVLVDGEVARRLTGGGFATYTYEREQKDKAYAKLISEVENLVMDGPRFSGPLLTVTVDEAAAPADSATRVSQFLDGQASWMTVSCAKGPKPTPAWTDGIIVTETTADLGDTKLKDRGFATFSYIGNLADDTSVIEADVVVGLPGFTSGVASPWQIRPYAAYKRRTDPKKPVNDLSFGLNWTQYVTDWELPLNVSGEFMTDDDFEADAHRFEVSLGLPLLSECFNELPDPHGAQCSTYVVYDHVGIDDPGGKPSLVALSDFDRVGAGIRLTYWRILPNDARIEATASYDFRTAFDGDDGDAEITRLKLALIPSETSHFSFTIEYANGEEIRSLTESETIKLSLGYRR